jgi:D-sedoheptulose 7-phosphate isomerase
VISAERTWADFRADLWRGLENVVITGLEAEPLPVEAGFHRWHDLTAGLRSKGKCLYLIGNGASASMSSHFAADLNKNARLRTQVFTDPALLTAIGNDLSFERIFAEPLTRRGQAGDGLLAVSSSGRSANILEAIRAARGNDMFVITLSGLEPDNPARRLGDVNVYVPALTYGLVETAHAALLHFWTDTLCGSAHQQADHG